LNLAKKYDARINASGAAKTSSAQAVEEIKKDSAGEYDTMIVDAFVKAFGPKSQAAAQ
jgi:HD-GYP domain-containing protein (c-di-GMP phosphodiesterase class II)